MNRRSLTLIALVTVGGVTLTLTGCKEDGPATKAGKAVDKAVETAGEKTGEAMEKTGDAVKKGGDAVKEATKNP